MGAMYFAARRVYGKTEGDRGGHGGNFAGVGGGVFGVGADFGFAGDGACADFGNVVDRFGLAIDYQQPLQPQLSADDRAWVETLLGDNLCTIG
jgi:hypothetical protein